MQANTYIRGCKVVILIDLGFTFNFINEELSRVGFEREENKSL